ncbi:MAG: hypothetical protein GXP25_00850 [Planctomycetes bacterium]|nr:hypothetical protein [Planctomycetota bacterium]
MPTDETSNGGLMHQYWAVAFIDILGQKEAIRQIDFIPNQSDSEQMNVFQQGVKRVYGRVKAIHDIFENWKNVAESPASHDFGLSQEQQKLLAQMTRSEIKYQRFSDGLTVFVSLREDGDYCAMSSVFSLLAACGAVMLCSLVGHMPIRGGVDVGAGAEMKPGELYGPAVANAYELESTVAQSPRVVVGDQLVHYLETQRDRTGSNPSDEFARKLAEICQNMLAEDTDGRPIVDYLGVGFRRYVANRLSIEEPYSLAFDFIVEELRKQKKARNTKLTLRYLHLLNYFEVRGPDSKGKSSD